ncbi:hypothetical protein LYSHEL_21840 [Lysobacter helvus]|uniref:ABM domain-containing protein n=2 Tax=Lysobacteraceae TaxID=32033 RepID=A0ABN6FTW3_9GAMM|nr:MULTISPECIES: antibiotic biosynthesis monooxygenase [Lysobacter]BCT93161.1 hypothetical protein LYSCAS_21850 [Lysobacter caseinilyticus]BCT96313.1 hypothetical protein LYSHEL_21840 [Lysobacter helvus]
MLAVIFEVEFADDASREAYVRIAAALRPKVEEVPGFAGVERFQSIADPRRYLSLSFWEDEAAIDRWREDHDHAAAQVIGSDTLFSQWRTSVVRVVRSRSKADRARAEATHASAMKCTHSTRNPSRT